MLENISNRIKEYGILHKIPNNKNMSIRKGNEPEDAKSTILDFIGDLKDNIFDSEEEQGDLCWQNSFSKGCILKEL